MGRSFRAISGGGCLPCPVYHGCQPPSDSRPRWEMRGGGGQLCAVVDGGGDNGAGGGRGWGLTCETHSKSVLRSSLPPARAASQSRVGGAGLEGQSGGGRGEWGGSDMRSTLPESGYRNWDTGSVLRASEGRGAWAEGGGGWGCARGGVRCSRSSGPSVMAVMATLVSCSALEGPSSIAVMASGALLTRISGIAADISH